MRFWGWAYLVITAAVAVLTKEHTAGGSGKGSGMNGHKKANGELQILLPGLCCLAVLSGSILCNRACCL
jgi:hypothetical protein